MTANRDQHYWHAATPREWQNSDSPYELVTVCFWSIVVVSLASLLMRLALGGQSSLTASRSLNATGAQPSGAWRRRRRGRCRTRPGCLRAGAPLSHAT
jgi:hypothetical protein